MGIFEMQHSDEIVESKSLETKVKDHTSPAVAKLLFLFNAMQSAHEIRDYGYETFDAVLDKMVKYVCPTPTDIECVVQCMGEQKSTLSKDDYEQFSGEFIASMIRQSFAAGHNGFYIDTRSFTRPPLISSLSGRKKRKIKIEYSGSVCLHGFSDMESVNLLCTGDILDQGLFNVHHCTITIKGNISNTMNYSSDCVVRVAGNAIDSFSCCESTRFIVGGLIQGCFDQTSQSRIYSPHRDILNQLSGDEYFDTSNTLYKIGANGRSRKVWPK